MSLHWFFDEIPEDYRTFRKRAEEIERDYLDVRSRLQTAAADLAQQPEDQRRQARVRYLQKRVADLERQAPWLLEEVLHEHALWGCPH